MKWIKKCPVFLLLVVSGLLFTLIGIVGRFSVYKDYEFDIVSRPFLALMMEGAAKGTAPWEIVEEEFPDALFNMFRNDTIGQSIGYVEGEDVLKTFAEGKEPDGTGGSGNEGSPGEAAGSPDEAAGSQDTAAGGADTTAAGDGTLGGKAESHGVSGGGTENHGMEEERTYEFCTVTEDYFNDAAFIGDSRTVGLFEYGGIEDRADFYAKISLTIYNVFTEQLAREEGTGKKITAEEALTKKQYGKVYLMLGINELGTGTTETFMEEYRAVVERIRQLQPDAVIFVEGIMKVTGNKDAEDPIFNNRNIEEKNAAIAKLADNQNIFYIDVNEAVCDAEGNLNAEYTIDEVHLKAKYYELWKQFLLEHGIER